jgi:hypothetical protein
VRSSAELFDTTQPRAAGAHRRSHVDENDVLGCQDLPWPVREAGIAASCREPQRVGVVQAKSHLSTQHGDWKADALAGRQDDLPVWPEVPVRASAGRSRRPPMALCCSLTGSVTFFLESGAEAKVLIEPSGLIDLHYTLTVNGERVEAGEASRRGTVWLLPISSSPAAEELPSAASSTSASPTPSSDMSMVEIEFGESSCFPCWWENSWHAHGSLQTTTRLMCW